MESAFFPLFLKILNTKEARNQHQGGNKNKNARPFAQLLYYQHFCCTRCCSWTKAFVILQTWGSMDFRGQNGIHFAAVLCERLFQLLLVFEITSSGWYFIYVYPAIYDWLSTSLVLRQISEASTTSPPSTIQRPDNPPLWRWDDVGLPPMSSGSSKERTTAPQKLELEDLQPKKNNQKRRWTYEPNPETNGYKIQVLFSIRLKGEKQLGNNICLWINLKNLGETKHMLFPSICVAACVSICWGFGFFMISTWIRWSDGDDSHPTRMKTTWETNTYQ